MDAEMNRKLSAVSPEEVETDTVKQEYGERNEERETDLKISRAMIQRSGISGNLVSVLPGQIFPY